MTSSGINDPTLIAAMLTTLLPFVAFVLIMVFTRAYPRFSAGLSILAVALSFFSALFLLIRHWGLVSPLQYTFRWVVSGDIQIPFGYLLDPVSLLMLVVVTGISFLQILCVHVSFCLGDDEPDVIAHHAAALYFLGVGGAFFLSVNWLLV
jgi:NADH-quinone oxidoreductase subunit L